MTVANQNTDAAPNEVYEVGAEDLPVSCPGPNTPLWNMHPKIYLDVATKGVTRCPYCGAQYRLKPGTHVHGH